MQTCQWILIKPESHKMRVECALFWAVLCPLTTLMSF